MANVRNVHMTETDRQTDRQTETETETQREVQNNKWSAVNILKKYKKIVLVTQAENVLR